MKIHKFFGGIVPLVSHALLRYAGNNFVLDELLQAHFGGKLFIKAHINQLAGSLLIAHMQKTYRYFDDQSFNYETGHTYVRPHKRYQDVLFRRQCDFTSVFWVGIYPVIITRGLKNYSSSATKLKYNGSYLSSTGPSAFCVKYFPGSFELEALLVNLLNDAADTRCNLQTIDNFCIKTIASRAALGRASSNAHEYSLNAEQESDVPYYESDNMLHPSSDGTPLGFTRNDFIKFVAPNALQHLALNDCQQQLVAEIDKWGKNIDWFHAHSVPWRRGYMLYGRPGTGKTSFVRAIGMNFGFPIYSIDLAGFANDELKQAWSSIASGGDHPRIILIEDIDSTFDGRTNTTDSKLTFDALLNCIDGAQQADGILLFITTNHREKVDQALAQDTDDEIGSRPGRIDRIIEFDTLDALGKHKVATRILQQPSAIKHVIAQSCTDETGAQFQERCIRYANEHFWSNDA